MFKNPLDSGRNMFAGDTKTQIWARDALPILVQRAQDNTNRYSNIKQNWYCN